MDQQLWELAEQYWDTVLEFSPSTATMLGDHRFDDQIEDITVDAEQRTTDAVATRRSVCGPRSSTR